MLVCCDIHVFISIAAIICLDMAYEQRFLTESERQKLQAVASRVEENLQVDEVIVHLFSRGVITHRKRAELEEVPRTSYEKSRMVFDHVFTSSYDKVMIFRDVLNETNQQHIARLIDLDS